MKHVKLNPLSAALRLSLLSLVTTVPMAMPAFAQDEGSSEQEMEAMVVTGSRIRRVDAENASPVLVIEREAIERTGALTIGQFIQQVPSIAGAATNPTVNNGGGSGAATVSLRGLGDVRTLTLINGHRMVYNDINSIPMAAVQSVEILKDGASAIYGSDAIGGVINFILKRDFEGGELNLNYGISGESDGQRYGGNVTYGWTGERGNVLINLNYNDQREISAADREYSAFALTLYSGEVFTGGSSRSPFGFYSIPREVGLANGLNCGSGARFAVARNDGATGANPRDYHCFGTQDGDLFNYQGVGNLQLTPQERAGVLLNSNFALTETINLHTELYTQNTRSYGQIAPLPFDSRPANDNVAIPANSVFNPFGVDIPDLRLRLSGAGNRRYSFETDVKQISSGINGSIGDTTWTYEAGVTYGRLTQDNTQTGYLFVPALADALGPSFRDANGVLRCGTPGNVIQNCTPVNFFGPLSSPEELAALATISPSATNSSTRTLKDVQANFTGSIMELPAGDLSAAVGLEYRKEALDFNPDALAIINTQTFTCLISSEACTSPTRGDFDVREVYGEVFVPVLADAQFAKTLNLTAGLRYSDYSTFGSTSNWKIGFEWRPYDDLLVRGTVAEVFRAPTITDLFSGQFASSDSFSDPCNGFTGGANPACVNVPRDGSFGQTDTQLSAIKGGNPNLDPEEGKVFTWGAVYDASWLPGFSTTVDFWKVYLNNTIGTLGTQNILNSCFNNGSFCNLFSRDANGEIIRLFDSNFNVGRTDTDGVDLGFRYRFESPVGDFRLSLDSTYVARYDVQNIIDGEVVARQDLAGTFTNSAAAGLGNFSRWRGLATVGWNLGNWEAQWTARYIHGFEVGTEQLGTGSNFCSDLGYALTNTPNPDCSFTRGSVTYNNLQVGYTIDGWNTKIQLGVDNLFDKQPPLVYQNNSLNGNVDERTFDTIGRYYWVNATIRF